MPNPIIIDLGTTFGRWTVLDEATRDRWRARMYSCQCTCGKARDVRASALQSGQSRSCGCTSADAQVTHGMSKSRLYGVWRGMLDRTENKNHWEYAIYRGTFHDGDGNLRGYEFSSFPLGPITRWLAYWPEFMEAAVAKPPPVAFPVPTPEVEP